MCASRNWGNLSIKVYRRAFHSQSDFGARYLLVPPGKACVLPCCVRGRQLIPKAGLAEMSNRAAAVRSLYVYSVLSSIERTGSAKTGKLEDNDNGACQGGVKSLAEHERSKQVYFAEMYWSKTTDTVRRVRWSQPGTLPGLL